MVEGVDRCAALGKPASNPFVAAAVLGETVNQQEYLIDPIGNLSRKSE